MIKNYVKITWRIVAGGICASVVWIAGLVIFFSPAQYFLADPTYQSRKFLEVFSIIEPLPRMEVQPVAFITGFILVGIALSWAYVLLDRWIQGSTYKKGLRFGLVAWLIAFPWFEFYLPWNVMHEPILLVLLELGLWLLVMTGVSITLAYVHSWLKTSGINTGQVD